MEVKRNYSAGIGSVIVQAPRALSTDIIRFRNKRAEDLKGRRYDQSRRFHKRTVSKRNKMTITHVVMFEFNSKVKDEDIADVCLQPLRRKMSISSYQVGIDLQADARPKGQVFASRDKTAIHQDGNRRQAEQSGRHGCMYLVDRGICFHH